MSVCSLQGHYTGIHWIYVPGDLIDSRTDWGRVKTVGFWMIDRLSPTGLELNSRAVLLWAFVQSSESTLLLNPLSYLSCTPTGFHLRLLGGSQDFFWVVFFSRMSVAQECCWLWQFSISFLLPTTMPVLKRGLLNKMVPVICPGPSNLVSLKAQPYPVHIKSSTVLARIYHSLTHV